MMEHQYDPVHPNLAADLLGVTVDDVYERIRQGELAVISVDGRWMVVLDAAVEPPASREAAVTVDPVSTVAVQSVDYRDELDQIRAQLQSLEETVRAATTTPRLPPPIPASPKPTLDPAANRRNWQGLIVLGVIVSLALAGSMVQSSSAQRSDDLTVVFVFVAGIVTGAIASWLALERRQSDVGSARQSAPEPFESFSHPRRSQRMGVAPPIGDGDS